MKIIYYFTLLFFGLISRQIIANTNNALNQPSFNIAAVQLQTTDIGNFVKMLELVRKAKARGADLVIFPEESVFSWLNPTAFLEADSIPGLYSDIFATIAKNENIWIAVGLAEKGPEAGPGSQKNAHHIYNSGILINPNGEIVLHCRQLNVIKNAFDPIDCKKILNQDQCSYIPGDLSNITCANTPFGKTSILVCADAFVHPPTEALNKLKELQPDFVIVLWGFTASTKEECSKKAFNVSHYTREAAMFLKTAIVVGTNAIGKRYFGKFLPSVYCGEGECANPKCPCKETILKTDDIIFFHINRCSIGDSVLY